MSVGDTDGPWRLRGRVLYGTLQEELSAECNSVIFRQIGNRDTVHQPDIVVTATGRNHASIFCANHHVVVISQDDFVSVFDTKGIVGVGLADRLGVVSSHRFELLGNRRMAYHVAWRTGLEVNVCLPVDVDQSLRHSRIVGDIDLREKRVVRKAFPRTKFGRQSS